MENTKNLSTEPGKIPSTKATTPGSPGSASHTTGSDFANTAASAAQRAKEGVQSAYEDTKQVVNDAYGKTTEVLTNTYDQAMVYGKDNPGKLTLIAFGAGIGVGVLLASGFLGGRSSRSSRMAEPIVNALSDVALAFLK
jgi:ElaB/YqjD/DUF883 family membrane-anchored ribosome-binding protein